MLGNERHRLTPTLRETGVIVTFGKDRKSRPITITAYPGSMTIIQAPRLNRHCRNELGPEGCPIPIIQAPHVNPWHERPWRRGALLGARTVARFKRSSFARTVPSVSEIQT